MKNPTPVIIVLVLLYLAGLGYLAFRESRRMPPAIHQQEQMVAPDGTVLNGPSESPRLAPTLDPTRPPQGQSVGPKFPPPPQAEQ